MQATPLWERRIVESCGGEDLAGEFYGVEGVVDQGRERIRKGELR